MTPNIPILKHENVASWHFFPFKYTNYTTAVLEFNLQQNYLPKSKHRFKQLFAINTLPKPIL